MYKILFLISILILSTLACAVSPLPTNEVANADTGNGTHYLTCCKVESPTIIEAKVTAYAVNIRTLDGKPTGEVAELSDSLYGYARNEWFIVTTTGVPYAKVWIGCVDVESDYGCESE